MATTEIYRVIHCGDLETYNTDNTGKTGNCRQLMLQELGSFAGTSDQGTKLTGTLVVKTFGSLALCQFYAGDVVAAAIRFEAKCSKEGHWYQSVVASDIVKIN